MPLGHVAQKLNPVGGLLFQVTAAVEHSVISHKTKFGGADSLNLAALHNHFALELSTLFSEILQDAVLVFKPTFLPARVGAAALVDPTLCQKKVE